MVLICCWSFGEEFSRFESYRLRQITFGKGFIVYLLKGRNNLLLLGKLSQSALEESFQVFSVASIKKLKKSIKTIQFPELHMANLRTTLWLTEWPVLGPVEKTKIRI